MVLTVSTIIGGVFYRFGEPLPYTREALPRHLVKYISEPASESDADDSPRSLKFETDGIQYGVDQDGNRFHRREIERQALNLMQAQEEQEAIEAALAQEPDAQVKAVMAIAEADYESPSGQGNKSTAI